MRILRKNEKFAFIVLAILLLAGCAGSEIRGDSEQSVYAQLGGEQGVDRLVEALLDEVYADRRIAFLFKDTDRDNLHTVIVEQVCAETGGPCTYEGLDMRAAHSGLDIRHDEFDAFVEDLIVAMERVKVPTPTQNRVLEIFAPMREDVVFQ